MLANAQHCLKNVHVTFCKNADYRLWRYRCFLLFSQYVLYTGGKGLRWQQNVTLKSIRQQSLNTQIVDENTWCNVNTCVTVRLKRPAAQRIVKSGCKYTDKEPANFQFWEKEQNHTSFTTSQWRTKVRGISATGRYDVAQLYSVSTDQKASLAQLQKQQPFIVRLVNCLLPFLLCSFIFQIYRLETVSPFFSCLGWNSTEQCSIRINPR